MVAQESAYMSSAIDRMLSLARSDAGKESLNLDEVNLDELLDELSVDIKVLAGEKGLNSNQDPGVI